MDVDGENNDTDPLCNYSSVQLICFYIHKAGFLMTQLI